MELRLATVDDAAEVQAIYAPYVEGSAVSFETEVPTVAELAARIEQVAASCPWIVAERGGDVIGYAYAHQLGVRQAYRWAVETTVYVRDDQRRQGVGDACYVALLALLRAQGYCRALAAIALPNPASVGLHERHGFRASGVQPRVGWKLGAWHDLGWWQLDLRPDDDPPVETVPVAELGDAVVARCLRPAA